jgi:phospholipase/carboxylesterase
VTEVGTLETVELETGPRPSATVIWLHGLGADGYDFVPVVSELGLPTSLPVRFVFPHAPFRPVTINGGMVMRAWYDVRPGDGERRADERGVRASHVQVEQLLSRERARGIPAHRMVLAGFSQGGAMTLFTGLRHAERLAGLLALSCYLLLPETLATEAAPANRDVPVFMGHGTDDPLIPLGWARRSCEALRALGYPVRWHEYRMGHEVCTAEIDDIGAWLREVLGR